VEVSLLDEVCKMKTKQNQNSIDQQLLQLVKQENPESVKQLIELAKQRLPISDEEARKRIVELVNQGKITQGEQPKTSLPTLSTYLRSSKTYWFWTTIVLSVATVMAVFTIPEDAYPAVYVRYVLGGIFVLWLPGYTFIKALYPTAVSIKTSSENLDAIERVALSVGMSLALVPIIGLLLNYTPWGITLTPITLSLLAVTLVFATTAIIREQQILSKQLAQTRS
jgi:hypothetical protein